MSKVRGFPFALMSKLIRKRPSGELLRELVAPPLAQWLGWLWPYAALVYVLLRLSGREGET